MTAAYTPSGEGPRPGFLVRLVATAFFTGYIPWGSGTFGSLVGCLVLLIPGVWDPVVLWPLAAIGFAAGVVTSARIARYEGHRLHPLAARAKAKFQPNEHVVPDPSMVVIDEVVGMWVSCLHLSPSLPALIIAFVFFRVFDVLKPPPARSAENIPDGWGIMLDDIIAGVYANVAAHFTLIVLSFFHVL